MNENNEPMQTGREIKNVLRRAVDSQEIPAQLELRIRSAIRNAELETAHKPSSYWTWIVPSLAAASLAAVILVFAASRDERLRPQGSAEAYIANVSRRVSTLMRVGLGDHIHCAVFRKYPKTPAPLETMKQELGPEYFPLVDVVKAAAPAEFEIQLAHKCRFEGRQFVHLVLKNNERLVSVIVTDRKSGEAFDAKRVVPVLGKAGIPFYEEGVDEFHIAAFENSRHFVYLISDLPNNKNLEMLSAMAGELNQNLPRT